MDVAEVAAESSRRLAQSEIPSHDLAACAGKEPFAVGRKRERLSGAFAIFHAFAILQSLDFLAGFPVPELDDPAPVGGVECFAVGREDQATDPVLVTEEGPNLFAAS